MTANLGTPAPGAVPAAPALATRAEVRPVGGGARARRTVAYAVLIGYALLMFVPFAWTIITSFKTQPDSERLTFFPNPFSTVGWEHAFTQLNPPIQVLFLNSFIVAIGVTVINVVVASMAGYAFARLRFPGRELLFILVLATLMMPDQLRLVPVYEILVTLGLINNGPTNYVALFLILAAQAQMIFLMRQYFLTIPVDLEEAARIDGAGHFRTFWQVMLPLATPAISAVTILTFQGTWNMFFWPLIILQSQDHFTVPLGLFQFRFQFGTDWPALMAVVLLATLPILVLYLFFQRYFVEGIAASGVKG